MHQAEKKLGRQSENTNAVHLVVYENRLIALL